MAETLKRTNLNAYELKRFQSSEDAYFLEIWKECAPYTMASFERGLALFRAVRYIVSRGLAGNFVECGVWQGGSTMIAIMSFQHFNDESRQFYLFDTFEGMTEPSNVDVDWAGESADAQMAKEEENKEEAQVWAYASLENVRKNVAKLNYPSGKIHYIQGDVRETLKDTRTGQISILRLDTDFYDSVYASLNELYHRLIRNGVLIIDDYGHWEGAKKAVDEFFSQTTESNKGEVRMPFLQRIDYTGRMMVKTDFTSRKDIMEKYHYVSPNLEKIDLHEYFPSVIQSAPQQSGWPFLRTAAPHIWETDLRSKVPNIGVLSQDESMILYNAALSFEGKAALEIGCHLGWSTAHLAKGGVKLDVVDPRLSANQHGRFVEESLERVGVRDGVELWAGYSPEIIPAVAKARGEPWELVFIDGDHDGEAPAEDFEAVEPYCAENACVYFHDVVAPAVLAAVLQAARKGWKYRFYNTMQIMAVIWRGDATPSEYHPDENMLPLSIPQNIIQEQS